MATISIKFFKQTFFYFNLLTIALSKQSGTVIGIRHELCGGVRIEKWLLKKMISI